MTIAATTAWGSALGTGTVGPFAVPFPLYSQTHLTVLQVSNNVPTQMNLGTDYVFSSWQPDNKGQVATPEITFTNPVTGGILIIFLLSPPGTQLTSITNQDAFFPNLHESEYDLEAQFSLRLNEWAQKSIKAPDFEKSGTTNLNLPAVPLRINSFLGFDQNGNAIVYSAVTAIIISLQAFGLFIGPAAVANNAALLAIPNPQGGWLAFQKDTGQMWGYNAVDAAWENIAWSLP